MRKRKATRKKLNRKKWKGEGRRGGVKGRREKREGKWRRKNFGERRKSKYEK